MKAIRDDSGLQLQVIVSGMHLAPKFGQTWRDIEAEDIRIDRKIPVRMSGDSNLANLKSISMGLNGFARALAELEPEILVLLGDRFELFAPAIAAGHAQHSGSPTIHGGELSEGAIDDSVRHALTKLASLHFAATETYRRRIIQMGESPKRVFNFGAPGLDLKLYGSPFLTIGSNLSGKSASASKIRLHLSPITRLPAREVPPTLKSTVFWRGLKQVASRLFSPWRTQMREES